MKRRYLNVATLFLMLLCVLSASFVLAQEDAHKLFNNLSKQYKVKKSDIGSFKIEEINYVRTHELFTNSSDKPTKVDYREIHYRINDHVYQSSMPVVFSKWNYLFDLQKIFMFSDNSLGLITFEATSGFSTGICGSAEELYITIHRILPNMQRITSATSYNVVTIHESECESIVKVGDMIMGPGAIYTLQATTTTDSLASDFSPVYQQVSHISNIKWSKEKLSITVSDESESPKVLNFTVNFKKNDDYMEALVERVQ